jgi:hypothetical protein
LASPSEHDGVQNVMRGIRRTIGTAPVQKKQPMTAERLAITLAHVPITIAGKRDRPCSLLGMAGALRRSELVALDVADLTFIDKGLDVFLRSSKTHQEGEGALVATPAGESLKPVAAVRQWIEAAAIGEGPLFRPIDKTSKISSGRLTDRSAPKLSSAMQAAPVSSCSTSPAIHCAPAS